jgi:hypothetical protein
MCSRAACRFAGGIISRTTQLVRGLRNTGAFGFEHIQVGNNPAEIVRVLPFPGMPAGTEKKITLTRPIL